MSDKLALIPAGSDITSPLSEFLSGLLLTSRAHVIQMGDLRNSGEQEAFLVHYTAALSTLEMLSAIVGEFVVTTKHMPG